ncbi:FAD:protein FMN transferase [Paenibacillus larvae]|uniref:FAD:protein FMN transferase n=3 Tax=Paenibacillus larvae TaxID=1464 RepID=V9W0B2_9BACL|nr:FAD:protein FMN transferase [Paenibacillus larvae]AHD04341.1 thiamine biosynthesis lipoprotein ApbE [Paenibacillus larvae subsp. larvae DSM 25430]AQR78422.1 thiamine biosynthesis protein ApbE [Paenibacillus larvae subsp. larvae]AVF20337.1 thiamine biosynthesis lipoprotein ApbE [Paenibacillus larvae subsp. larvae]AVG10946.1 thiamine biosynthesis lipoprotein ApbE [Paenibacillus larvae subsp. larvae DSM 25430]MCY7478351.1 FAD:protein FMN transferase [Paenibacillus larvae]
MHTFKKTSILLFSVMLAIGLVGCSNQSESKKGASTAAVEPKSETYFIFDTIVTIKVYDPRVTDQNFKEMHDMMKDIDQKMSRTVEDSELSKIQQAAGKEAVKISDETYYVIKTAMKYAEMLDGRFDPAIGPLVSLWGIGTEGAKVPPKDEIEKNRKLSDFRKITLHDEDKSVKLEEAGMALDLGGIAKGYIADRIADYLTEHDFHSAIIDLGGNIFALGKKPDGRLWTVGVQDPAESRGNQIGNIKVDNQTVVTSGIYERYFVEDGKHYHHILDPDTGYPVENNLSSVTILTDKSIDADALAKTFTLGLEKGLDFVEKLKGVEAVFITKDKKVYTTSGMKLNLTNDKYTLVASGN